jgi:hypothetical protein
MSIENGTPPRDECVTPLRLLQGQTRLRPFFSCILSEFRDSSVAWHEVMPVVGVRISNALRLDVYGRKVVVPLYHNTLLTLSKYDTIPTGCYHSRSSFLALVSLKTFSLLAVFSPPV